MARTEIYQDRVVIRLTSTEKLAAFQRENVILDRADIRQAVITDDPWIFTRGVYSRGTHIPGRRAAGVWRHLGGRDFLLIKNGKESLVLDLEKRSDDAPSLTDGGEHFSDFVRVVLSTQHAAEIIAALNLEGDQDPAKFNE